MIVRALIADDEPPARSKVRKFLQARNDIEVVAETGDGIETIEKTLELRPDLLLLDIQMPRGDGFDVLREVYRQEKPIVIFTTAYDEYAIRAFEVEALDYLLKPFTSERLNAAVDRAIRSLEKGKESTEQVARLLDGLRASNRIQRLLVRADGRIFFVKTSDIEWIEAEEKYVFLHTRSQRHMIRQSISALEAQLAPASFVRIHRCHLINLEALQEIVPWAHGDYLAILKSGVRLNVGRNFKDNLLRSVAGEQPSV
ncbi:MAG TPA: LytTR family DNA-binding domain-containing protein [Candidatus Limnocylindrales bacterium]|jgi:two-component system LytT family response regulator|nr:LytTR family DNA-binding domain-containing protein [Candidatus Limnocylindrales bacterium]